MFEDSIKYRDAQTLVLSFGVLSFSDVRGELQGWVCARVSGETLIFKMFEECCRAGLFANASGETSRVARLTLGTAASENGPLSANLCTR